MAIRNILSGVDYGLKDLPAFLSWGFLYLLVIKLFWSPKDFFQNIFYILAIHLLFLLLFYFFDLFIVRGINNVIWQYFVFYLVAGIVGMVAIEWLIQKNMIMNFFAQAYLFSFWSSIVIIPKLLIEKNSSERFYFDICIWLSVVAGFFIALGGLVYFFSHQALVWQASCTVMVISFNVVYGMQFYSLYKWRKTEEEKKILAEKKVIEEYRMEKENDITTNE